MRLIMHARLVCRALYELIRYDVRFGVRGFEAIRHDLERPAKGETSKADVRVICEAVDLAACFYWKTVLCLQRAACTVRLLRAHGADSHLVIGYRPLPFFSHAWVEIDGQVVNDSPVYRERLNVLYTV